MRSLICALVISSAAVLVGTATASSPRPVQTLTIVNQANVSPYRLRSIERAIAHQVDAASRWWQLPSIRFGKGGWIVVLTRKDGTCGKENDGCHEVSNGSPKAIVRQVSDEAISDTMSHEILEMLADPNTGDKEICDPVYWKAYKWHGITLADFVLPSWYMGSRPADYLSNETFAGKRLP